jgi:hypothetical protein
MIIDTIKHNQIRSVAPSGNRGLVLGATVHFIGVCWIHGLDEH